MKSISPNVPSQTSRYANWWTQQPLDFFLLLSQQKKSWTRPFSTWRNVALRFSFYWKRTNELCFCCCCESERWWSGSGWWCRTEMMIVVVIISEEATFWLVRLPFAFLRFSSLHSSSEWWKCFSSLPFQKEIIMTRTVTLGVRSRSCSHSTTSRYPIVFHLLSVFSCSRWSSQHQFSSTVHLSS